MSNIIITSKDFEKIAIENEYFLWHFTIENPMLEIQSYFTEDFSINPSINKLKFIIDGFKIPYFESKVKEEIDFLNYLSPELSRKSFTTNAGKFNPVIIGFNKRRIVQTTFNTCYCAEGLIDLIHQLNPNFLSNND